MSSIGDEARAEQRERERALTPEQRLQRMFALGDWAVRVYAETRGLTLLEARRELQRNNQVGRLYSQCHMDIINGRDRD